METQQLLFELCHETRYRILNALAHEPQRLTRIGELVDANNPEVSRHLDRLKNAGLVEKEPEGTYRLSPMGVVVLTILPGLSFVAHNADHLRDHDLSGLPPSFIARLGELASGRKEEGVFNSIQHGLDIARLAKEKILIFTREPNMEFRRIINERINEGVHFRMVVEKNFRFLPTDQVPSLPEYRQNTRGVERIPIMFILSEDQAGIGFPDRKGVFHFSETLFSTDSAFKNWCEDLFEYLWSQSEALGETHGTEEREQG